MRALRICGSLTLTVALAFAALSSAGCSKDSPTTPSTQAPGTTTFVLTGVVTSSTSQPVANASVDVVLGPNAGRHVVTNPNGRYVLDNLLPGAVSLQISAPGFATQTTNVTLTENQTVDVSLTSADHDGQFVTAGRALDVLSNAGIPSVTISGDGITCTPSDGVGLFRVASSASMSDPRLVVFHGPAIVERRTNLRVPGAETMISLISNGFDLHAFDEMFRSPILLRWTSAPSLLIETRVVEFSSVDMETATAASDAMSDLDHATLLADLRWALPGLTGGTFGDFAGASRQTSQPGATVQLLNTGKITVTRVAGLSAATGSWGYGRWQYRADGTVTGGVVLLDQDFELTNSHYRRSLHAHELGHALGYQHVGSRPSVMNALAQTEPTQFDLDAARIAFKRTPGNRSPDTDPADASVNRVPGPARWSSAIR